MGFFCRLQLVARSAGAQHVRPGTRPAATGRDDVLALQISLAGQLPAVGTDVAVATEQLVILTGAPWPSGQQLSRR